MTISENLLFQMYSMMDNAKLPDLTPAESSDKSGSKSSFQDLMEQTRKDAAAPQKAQDSSKKEDTKAPEKTEKADTAESTEESEQPKLENTNYCAAYLFRPEILPMPEESAPVVQAEQVLTVELLPSETATQVIPQEEMILTQTGPETEQTIQTTQPQVQTAPETELTQTETPVTVEAPKAETQTRRDTNTQSDLSFDQSQDSDNDLAPQVTHTQQPLFRDVESTPVKVGETYELDTTAPEMDIDLADTIRSAADAGLQKLEIQLTPQNLGKIVVELTQSTDGTLQVVLHAANQKASGLLSQHLDSLNTALQNLGQQTQVHVEVSRNQDASDAQQHPFQQADPDGHNRQQQQQSRKESQSDSDDFLQQLRLGLFSLEETT